MSADWTEVDEYITDQLVPADPVLEAALRASHSAGLPHIQVSPNQGKLLQLLALACGAKRILEIGTLGGYSTIWLGRALPPEGRLITVEVDAKHAEVAQTNIAHAGLAGMVEVRCARAQVALDQMLHNAEPPFDLVFIDADKPGNPEYFRRALQLSRPGTMIVVDNVVRDGAVVNSGSNDADVLGTRRLYEVMAAEPRVSATAIQTVGSKGWDGFAIALVTAEVRPSV